jgi:uncharacterized membrane protein
MRPTTIIHFQTGGKQQMLNSLNVNICLQPLWVVGNTLLYRILHFVHLRADVYYLTFRHAISLQGNCLCRVTSGFFIVCRFTRKTFFAIIYQIVIFI